VLVWFDVRYVAHVRTCTYRRKTRLVRKRIETRYVRKVKANDQFVLSSVNGF
jgi:hypothetical protein